MEYVTTVRMRKFVRMTKRNIFLCQTASLCNHKHQPGSAFTQTCLYPHCKAWVYVQGGLQTKQSVAPAEGSKAGGGAAAALLAVQDSPNEHHVSDFLQLLLLMGNAQNLHHSSFCSYCHSCKAGATAA